MSKVISNLLIEFKTVHVADIEIYVADIFLTFNAENELEDIEFLQDASGNHVWAIESDGCAQLMGYIEVKIENKALLFSWNGHCSTTFAKYVLIQNGEFDVSKVLDTKEVIENAIVSELIRVQEIANIAFSQLEA